MPENGRAVILPKTGRLRRWNTCGSKGRQGGGGDPYVRDMTAWFCAKGGPTIGVDAGLVATASAGLLVGKSGSLGVRKKVSPIASDGENRCDGCGETDRRDSDVARNLEPVPGLSLPGARTGRPRNSRWAVWGQ